MSHTFLSRKGHYAVGQWHPNAGSAQFVEVCRVGDLHRAIMTCNLLNGGPGNFGELNTMINHLEIKEPPE